jgi:hypothetical protein
VGSTRGRIYGRNSYLQLLTPGTGPSSNPGTTAADGSKSVAWSYKTLLSQLLESKRSKGPDAGAVVVILAVPCLADNIPAKTSTAAVTGYRLSEASAPARTTTYPHGFKEDRLVLAACETNT